MLTIQQLLERQATRHAERIALVDDATGETWTIAALHDAAKTGAAVLARAGISPGDRVGILSHNHPSVVLVYLAVAHLGAVLVPVNARSTPTEIGGIVADAGCVALVVQAELAESGRTVADEIGIVVERRWSIDGNAVGFDPFEDRIASGDVGPPPSEVPGPDDLLYLMYTSGTTGRPKGAMHTHASTIAAGKDAVLAMDYRPGDRYLNVMPLFHVASLAMVNICLIRRCTMVLGRSFDPETIWERMEDRRINAMMAVPAMLQAMAATHRPDLDVSSLRVLSTGAAPVPKPLLEKFSGLGIEIVQAYGLTETGGAVTVLDGADATSKLGSAGKPILGLEFRLVDRSGRDVGDDEPGEILVRGPAVTLGYWNLPEASAEAICSDGWFRTGDIGVRDGDGFVTIVDRVGDLVISGGENVYPAEIESVLVEHPSVADVAVIGQSSSRWGESPCAVIVPAGDLDVDDLLDWAAERLAGFKRPRTVEIVDELPRNASGKILKTVLRERFPGPAPL